MNRQPEDPDTPLEADAVWDLIDQAPPQPASAQFVRKTMQLVLREQERRTWWKRLLSPGPLAGLAAASAAVALAVTMLQPAKPSTATAGFDSPHADEIAEFVATEMLMAAAENPSEFSDQELVCLLGF